MRLSRVIQIWAMITPPGDEDQWNKVYSLGKQETFIQSINTHFGFMVLPLALASGQASVLRELWSQEQHIAGSQRLHYHTPHAITQVIPRASRFTGKESVDLALSRCRETPSTSGLSDPQLNLNCYSRVGQEVCDFEGMYS